MGFLLGDFWLPLQILFHAIKLPDGEILNQMLYFGSFSDPNFMKDKIRYFL